jgi:hypothetical protein
MSGGSFESSQRTEPVCASRFSSIKNCFKTRASGLARGRGWSRIGHSVPKDGARVRAAGANRVRCRMRSRCPGETGPSRPVHYGAEPRGGRAGERRRGAGSE